MVEVEIPQGSNARDGGKYKLLMDALLQAYKKSKAIKHELGSDNVAQLREGLRQTFRRHKPDINFKIHVLNRGDHVIAYLTKR